MRIHSNKSLLFRGDDKKESIKNGEIKDLPNWIAKTDTFRNAQAEGSLFIISTKKQKIQAENGDKIEETKGKKNKSKDKEASTNIEDK